MKGKKDELWWYYANRSSPAVPDGFGQEDTIKAIWAEDERQRSRGGARARRSR